MLVTSVDHKGVLSTSAHSHIANIATANWAFSLALEKGCMQKFWMQVGHLRCVVISTLHDFLPNLVIVEFGGRSMICHHESKDQKWISAHEGWGKRGDRR